MQYVIEFGSDNLESVVNCIVESVGLPTRIEVSAPDVGGPAYCGVDEDLRSVLDKLRSGALNSVILRLQANSVRYALITAPYFLQQQLSIWMGTVEVTGPNWRDIWNLLLTKRDLRFVCVGLEEGIEVTDDALNTESFPWNISPVIISAVRRNDGTWLVHKNSAVPSTTAE